MSWQDDIKSIEKNSTSSTGVPKDTGYLTDKYGRAIARKERRISSGRDESVKIDSTGLPNFGAWASLALTSSYLALLGSVLLYVDALKNVLCGGAAGAGLNLGFICLILWPLLMATALILSGAGIATKRGKIPAIGVVIMVTLPMLYLLWIAVGGPGIDWGFLVEGMLPEGQEVPSLGSLGGLTSMAPSNTDPSSMFDFCTGR